MAVPKGKVSSARQNKRRSNVWKLQAPAAMPMRTWQSNVDLAKPMSRGAPFFRLRGRQAGRRNGYGSFWAAKVFRPLVGFAHWHYAKRCE